MVRQLAAGSTAILCPMSAIFGGIVGQEVVKAATGKFHPIHQARATHVPSILNFTEATRSYFLQAFYLDALECLPPSPPPPAETSAAAIKAAGAPS